MNTIHIIRSYGDVMLLSKPEYAPWHAATIKLKTPWLLVRTRTIPTERPLLVGEVSANFCG
jgi:hypothetical protein